MNKTEYLLRSFQKISHKKWELYIISRIIHQLNDGDIEFITQQLVRRKDGTIALMDLYFPQLNIHLEINETHHANEENLRRDSLREQDIIDITNRKPFTIQTYVNKQTNDTNIQLRDLEEIHKDVEEFCSLIKSEKENRIKNKNFEPWDFDSRYDPNKYIRLGEISISGNVVLKTHADAMRLFGFKGAGYQRGGWKIKDGSNDILWFPRLYQHGIWTNELCDNGKIIYERAINDKARDSLADQRNEEIKNMGRKIIVFAKAKDPLGFNMLRYVGTFKMNLEDISKDYIRFDLISTTEKIRNIP